MNGKELINRVIEHRQAPRHGYCFNSPYPSDFQWIPSPCVKADSTDENHLYEWGRHEALLKLVPGFSGEVRLDNTGNILGRFESRTKGECIRGILQDGWDDLDSFQLLKFDFESYSISPESIDSSKFIVAGSPFSIFSTLRDARLINNALVDVLLEPESVKNFVEKVYTRITELIDPLKRTGADALMMADDWGTQDRTFISPDSFRELFKPFYKRLTDRLHDRGMKFILHSCGYNYSFLNDLIDAGVDVLQFDQLGLYGYERMAKEYGRKVTFFSPLDIQKTLPTGDRKLIEEQARIMTDSFRFHSEGGLIIKDYPSYADINVDEEWATWARDIFIANSNMLTEKDRSVSYNSYRSLNNQ